MTPRARHTPRTGSTTRIGHTGHGRRNADTGSNIMRAGIVGAAATIALTLAACSGTGGDGELDAELDLASGIGIAPAARATMVNTSGDVAGEALLWSAPNGGVLMRLSLANVQTDGGFHGLHFHAVGQCDGAAGFASAAGHIMPTNAPHGFLNPDGPHEGNLPNLYLHNSPSAFGVGEYYTSLVTLDDGPAGLLDADGATVIVHQRTDDHFTQPIGGAGGRIACGVIEALGE